jgi:hypothetical protein
LKDNELESDLAVTINERLELGQWILRLRLARGIILRVFKSYKVKESPFRTSETDREAKTRML